MELPLSATALVPVGLGAVVIGVAILLVLGVRRLVLDSGSTAPARGRFSEVIMYLPDPRDDARNNDASGHDSGRADPEKPTAERPAEPVDAGTAPDGEQPPPVTEPDRTGSSRVVADAVAKAFAVRAAASRPGGKTERSSPERASNAAAPTGIRPYTRPETQQADREKPSPRVVPGDGYVQRSEPLVRSRGPADPRDRLLSVLFADPARTLGAVEELETSRRELERLSDAVRQERTTLRDALTRLATAGLTPDQLARLAGIPLEEVRAALPAGTSSQRAS